MDAYSPWGTETDELPVPSFPSRLPSFDSPSLSFNSPPIPAASDWGNDAGWGPAAEDYESVGIGGTAGGETEGAGLAKGMQLDVIAPASVQDDTRGGWGGAEDDTYAATRRQEDHARLDDATSSPIPTSSSPSLPLDISSQTLPSQTYSPPAQSPPAKESDWGNYGTSPTFETLPLPEPTLTASRDDGWGGDEEWQPSEIREAMPTFGSSFGGGGGGDKPVEVAEEGWGGSTEPSTWEGQERAAPAAKTRSDRWSSGDQASGRGKSIPAALVDGLKVNSREFANSTWPVTQESWGTDAFVSQSNGVTPLLTSLMQPPALPSKNTDGEAITASTPLPALFRLTPTLYPAFRDGLDKTAVRSAETLKGTSSPAYRNARFGRGTTRAAREEAPSGWNASSGLGTPPLQSDRGRAGDEFDLDAAETTPSTSKSSWWGGHPTAPSTNMPKGLLTRKDSPDPIQAKSAGSSPNPGSPSVDGESSSALGRFFGRLKRPPVVSAEEEGEDGIVDLDAIVVDLDRVNGRRLAGKGVEANIDQLDDFFGEAQPKDVTLTPRAPASDGFDGLMGTFGSESAATARAKASRARTLDPFDPFGDDNGGGLAALSLAPTVVPSRPSTPAIAAPRAQPVLALSPPVLAPQPRGISSLSSPLDDDSIDDFFSSPVLPATQFKAKPIDRPSSPPSLPPAPRSIVSPPPHPSITLPPPPRPSTISPPPSNPPTRASTFFAPPPPPSQPLRGFGIAPPPSATSTAKPSVAPLKPPAAPTRASSGPLSFDDLSFFEN